MGAQYYNTRTDWLEASGREFPARGVDVLGAAGLTFGLIEQPMRGFSDPMVAIALIGQPAVALLQVAHDVHHGATPLLAPLHAAFELADLSLQPLDLHPQRGVFRRIGIR